MRRYARVFIETLEVWGEFNAKESVGAGAEYARGRKGLCMLLDYRSVNAVQYCTMSLTHSSLSCKRSLFLGVGFFLAFILWM